MNKTTETKNTEPSESCPRAPLFWIILGLGMMIYFGFSFLVNTDITPDGLKYLMLTIVGYYILKSCF